MTHHSDAIYIENRIRIATLIQGQSASRLQGTCRMPANPPRVPRGMPGQPFQTTHLVVGAPLRGCPCQYSLRILCHTHCRKTRSDPNQPKRISEHLTSACSYFRSRIAFVFNFPSATSFMTRVLQLFTCFTSRPLSSSAVLFHFPSRSTNL